MNEAAKLVAGSVLDEGFATITIKGKTYFVYPPSIKVICRACVAFAKIGLEDNYTELSVIGEIPNNAEHIVKGLSMIMAGDRIGWRYKSFFLRRVLQSATNKELKEVWDNLFPLLGGRDFFDCALSMKSAVQMIAREK